ncbi:MAG: division/cell wall cluster transcriptional repressor MraZ [Polyangiales bacterium]
MLRGRYEHAVDEKGRTSVPSRFRDVMTANGDTHVVLTTGLEPCLVAYPMREWLAFEERLAKLPQFDANVAMLRRIYVSGAVECELDKHGRILVPANLRKHANLGREALWAGMGRHAEIWAVDRFDAMRDAALEDEQKRAEMAKRLAELGL